MSASQIPNLNTLRRGGGRGRQRARAGNPGGGAGHAESAASRDKVVQQTDQDASLSRLSAVELGYLHDPFAKISIADGSEARRYPIINRGTYVRTTAIDTLVSRFLNLESQSRNTKRQIISLGAGSDTRVFRLLSEHPELDLVYHELDFATNTCTKINKILSSPSLLNALRISGQDDNVTISPNRDALHSPFLHIHPVDLRNLTESHAKTTPLEGVDTTLPTLLISECCLVYLSPGDAVKVVSYFTDTLFPQATSSSSTHNRTTPLALVIYEPIRPDDPFGKTMVSNLANRGIQLQTLHKYASLDAQRERLRDHGFASGQGVADIDYIWQTWIGQDEKERVAGLEMLDEIEEWTLLAKHYCVAWGWREDGQGHTAGEGGSDTKSLEVFEGWKELPSQH